MSTRGAERPSESDFDRVREARQSSRAADVLTLRDYFAAAALRAILADHSDDPRDAPTPDEVAEQAYRYANAMVAAR